MDACYNRYVMVYTHQQISKVAELLRKRHQEHPGGNLLRSAELKALYDEIKLLKPKDRKSFGQEVNQLRKELASLQTTEKITKSSDIDVTAPFDVNTPATKRPALLSSEKGSQHPLMTELSKVISIFEKMGFESVDSRQIDDDYHMFGSLNFPEGHPARDDYDTFMTSEGLIAPAHTSTMQNRVLKKRKKDLLNGKPIAAVVTGRVFRNEDLDATHEHTFYQVEGVYVDNNVTVGNLMATLKAFLEAYYQRPLEVRTQPFYFPFTEPSFEFALKRPDGSWLELIGCGLIHPNVLKMAGIDPTKYSGFAWGFGFDRLVMMKYGIEDIRHLESGKIEFLRQFK